MNPALQAQIQPYEPWLIISGVVVFFLLLRVTRKRLRQRVDEIGYHFLGERGSLVWFWLNAPGVMLHELSHAFVVLLFRPFGFRITSITLFRIKPKIQVGPGGRNIKSSRQQSLQLGEVQYVRPQHRFMSYVGDGLSGIAPLFGGIGMLILLYWVATGYNLWDIGIQRIFRPGWPWWTLIFAPYLILTITSELWPSRQDWKGARWFVVGVLLITSVTIILLWYTGHLLPMLPVVQLIASRIDFALLILLALDVFFILIAETVVRIVRHR